jgi:[acyl-carrier-protein] S-malonyltransferase
VLALLFPGQGSQEVGMGRDVCQASRAARAVFEAADATLSLSLSRLCFEGPESELLRTELQQPAILTVSVALLRALEERLPVQAAYLAGHSLGEYAALVASGSLSFEDAVSLVHARGRFMQEAVPPGRGGMAAILGLGPEGVDEACEAARRETGQVVQTANQNGPTQAAVAGDAAAVEAACREALRLGASRALPLPVSAPFHCELMAPAAAKLEGELRRVRFEDPCPPVLSCVEAEPNAKAARVPELLRRQVTHPVRFTAMVRRLRELGVGAVLEVGPGRVLCGLVRRIEPGVLRAGLSGVEELSPAADFVYQNGG